MSFDADEEILQDFLVEAGEILEVLSEQLVELENRPDDANLLNAIFRGFHTVKGGAGFLQLHELGECCHIAENVFDILRKGERHVDSELMDVILEALVAVNGMFSEVRERAPITAATPELLAALACLAETDETSAAPGVGAALGQAPTITSKVPAATASAGTDITDDEFEALLDQLHGKGSFAADALPEVAATAAAPAAAAAAAAAAPAGDGLISDHEFEALLDELHGKGKFAEVAAGAAATAAPVAAKPAPAKAAAPAAAKPAPAPAAAAPAAAARAPAAAAADKPAREAETTVRVDTARLEDRK